MHTSNNCASMCRSEQKHIQPQVSTFPRTSLCAKQKAAGDGVSLQVYFAGYVWWVFPLLVCKEERLHSLYLQGLDPHATTAETFCSQGPKMQQPK